MNDDLERRLQDSLRARAQDVEPTPELYRRVEAKMNRSKRWTLVLSGVGVAAAVAVAAVALPALLTDDRVAGVTVADHVVLAGDDRIWLAEITSGDEVAELVSFQSPENESEIVAVEVRPGSTVDDLTVVYVLQGEGRFTFGSVTFDGTEATSTYFPDDYQPSAELVGDALPVPAFDPTGTHLAWIEPLRGEDNQSPVLQTIGWSDGPGAEGTAMDNANFTLDAIPIEAPPSDFVVDDWVWTGQADGTRRGRLLVTGAQQAWRVPIQEHGDGALALDDPIELIEVSERVVIDLAATVGDLTYQLVAGGATSQDAEDANLTVLVTRPDGQDEHPVPDVATSDPSAVWMTVYGDGYAIGLGGRTQVFLPDGQYQFDASYADFVR